MLRSNSVVLALALATLPLAALAQSTASGRDAGQTRTLDDLRVEYAAASCGSEAERAAAKQNLLTALDRAIAIERSPQKRDRLLAQRQRVADDAVGKRPCPKPVDTQPPAESPMSTDAYGEIVAKRFSIADAVETRFRLAESARLAGDCVYWSNVLGSIETLIGKPGDATSDDEVARAALLQWRERLSAERAKPCPVPAVPPPPEKPKGTAGAGQQGAMAPRAPENTCDRPKCGRPGSPFASWMARVAGTLIVGEILRDRPTGAYAGEVRLEGKQ